jgi:Rrf2 family protein
MIMAINSRMASATHIMCFIAYRGGEDGTTSEAIAKSVKTNPVVIRKILKSLEHEGLVALRQGRNGGVSLRRAPGAITLGDIYRAVEREDGVFALRQVVNPSCVLARSMGPSLEAVFRSVDDAVAQKFQQTTLADLLRAVP